MERLRPVYETGVLRLLLRGNSMLYVALLRSTFDPLTGELPREIVEERFSRSLTRLAETGDYTPKEGQTSAEAAHTILQQLTKEGEGDYAWLANSLDVAAHRYLYRLTARAHRAIEALDRLEDTTKALSGAQANSIIMEIEHARMQLTADPRERIRLLERDIEERQKQIDELKHSDTLDKLTSQQVGDIIGVTGYVFRTKTGEITVHAQKTVLLSKSLRPLPEKFHGMTNVELRYRQRYLDLIMSDDSRRNFEIRSRFISYIRSYLGGRGYMEVETPVLNTISGGATARPFITHHNTLDMDMYLRIATELNLKRLIVGGIERVYEIGRIFRNEGMDTRHNPEFTTVELYEAYGDMYTMMDLFEELLSGAAKEILGTYELEWLGEKISLAPGWRRMTMAEAVKEYTGIDFMAINDDAGAAAAAAAAGVDMSKKEPTWGNALYETFDQKVEEMLIQPTFITAHPVDVSPLAKRDPADPRLTLRFELFICRSEMGNAFSELNDPIDQKARFQKQMELRAGGDDEAGMMDEDFINALEYGMPPTGGLGIGVDRCVMLLTGCSSIRDVILFPTMKPQE